ncbi:hypothetical protein V6Z12_A03G068900 [Gossypium hirsutum]
MVWADDYERIDDELRSTIEIEDKLMTTIKKKRVKKVV